MWFTTTIKRGHFFAVEQTLTFCFARKNRVLLTDVTFKLKSTLLPVVSVFARVFFLLFSTCTRDVSPNAALFYVALTALLVLSSRFLEASQIQPSKSVDDNAGDSAGTPDAPRRGSPSAPAPTQAWGHTHHSRGPSDARRPAPARGSTAPATEEGPVIGGAGTGVSGKGKKRGRHGDSSSPDNEGPEPERPKVVAGVSSATVLDGGDGGGWEEAEVLVVGDGGRMVPGRGALDWCRPCAAHVLRGDMEVRHTRKRCTVV